MGVVKAFRFPVEVSWEGGRVTRALAFDKPPLEVTTPPEFKGPTGYWSPEDLLVASAATCYAVTLAAVAERRCITLLSLEIGATGHVSRRDDGRFGFVAIELHADIEVDVADTAAAERAAARAEEGCLIAQALDIPVTVHARVRAAAPAPVGA